MSISRSHVHAVLTNLRTNQLIAQREHALPDTSPPSVIHTVVSLAQELSGEAGMGRDVVGLGVAVAGHVDDATGMVNFAPDLQTSEHPWKGLPLEDDLEVALRDSGNFHVVVENDANALGIYEYLLEGEEESVAVVLLSGSGKGIGAGLVINQAIARGFGGVSGENWPRRRRSRRATLSMWGPWLP